MILVTRPTPPQPHPFKTYKDKHVVAELNRLFKSKCAYCESRITAVGPTDVEHYRPKGEVLEDDGTKRKGYGWLKLEWTNLLPSCIDCNRERRQELVAPGGSTTPGKGGKACKFPLRDPSKRAKKRGEETGEAPLLLDPCNQGVDPAAHLRFTANGSVQALLEGGAVSDRGKATIAVTGLHRSGLVEWRRKRLDELELQMEQVCEFTWRVATEPKGQFHAADQRSALAKLHAMAGDACDYVGMAAQAVAHFESVLKLLEPYLAVEIELDKKPSDAVLLKKEKQLLDALGALAHQDHPWRDLTRRVQQYVVGKFPPRPT